MLVDQHLLGEDRQVERLMQDLAFPLQAAGGAGEQFDLGVVAEIGVAGGAVLTLAAEYRQAGDDMIAGLDVCDVLADRFNHRGAFMTEYRGGGIGIQALHEMQVRMAEPGESGAQQHFPALGLFDLYFLDCERLVRCVKDCGFHGRFLRFLIRLKP